MAANRNKRYYNCNPNILARRNSTLLGKGKQESTSDPYGHYGPEEKLTVLEGPVFSVS